MRITLLICFVTTVSLQVIASSGAKGQGIANVNIGIVLDNDDLLTAIKKIEKNTSFRFLYRTSDFKDVKKISLTEKSISVESLMKELLTGSGLSFKQIDERIIITRNSIQPRKLPENVGTMANDSLVTGSVVDGKTKDRIIGATVAIKNRTTKVLTDIKGNFKISAPIGSTLLISYVGYESQEIVISKTKLDVKLEESAQSLKAVVVTGLYERSKESYTGASKSFTAEDLGKVSNNNLFSALRSLDPSFQIVDNINMGANPNAMPNIVLRGGNSLPDLGQQVQANPFNYTSNPNTPLFILDGFEVSASRINDLDMNRIARVDILKDAGATAIYGSRAANGVIVIETVRPKGGKLRFSYNGSLNVEAPDLSGYDLLNAREKLDIELRTGTFNDVFNTRRDQKQIVYNDRLSKVTDGVNTNWLAKPLTNGVGQKHNIYLEGGADKALYGANLTYNQRNGVMKGSDRKTITGNTYLSYRVNNFLFRNDLTLNFNDANNSPYGSFTQYARLNPYWSPYDSNGNLKVYLETVIDPQTGQRLTNFDSYDNLDGQPAGRPVNPLYNASLNVVDKTSYYNLQNNFLAQWQAQQWLRFTGRLSYQRQNDESDVFLPAQHTSFVAKPTFEKGTYTKGYGRQSALEGFLSADVNKTFNKHLFFSTISLNLQESRYSTESFKVQGFPNPKLDQLVLGNRFPEGSKPTGTESLSRLAGFMGNVNYAYDSKYLLDFSYRLDGSSQFGSQNRFAPFWSAGAGWNLHNEEFFKKLKVVDRFRLRYSYGYTGSQNFNSYLGITTSEYFTDKEYRGIIGPYLLGYGNTGLAWQKTLKNNFGTDITLFKRLDLTANYFVERTKGSIATISTSPSTGFDFYYDNIGDVLNKGFEVNATYNIISNIKNRNNWSVFVNAFKVSNKIEKISNTLDAYNKKADNTLSSTPILRYAEGQSTSAIWAVRSLGIDPSTGDELFRTKNGAITSVYNPLDQVIVGDTRANLEGTFGTNFEMNGIGFNMYFRFSFGGQAYNQTLIDRVENVDVTRYNVDRRVYEERWTKPGDIAFFKGINDQAGYLIRESTKVTSRFVQNNNFVSLENASVYYRFSDRLNKKIGLQNTRVSIFSSNLFQASSIKRERGLDYPFSHSYTLQLQTSF